MLLPEKKTFSEYDPDHEYEDGWNACLEEVEKSLKSDKQLVLYGYATPSGKLYASGMLATANGEQSFVKVYVKKEEI